MLTRALTAFVLAATPQVPTPTSKLAGPPVEARWSGTIPPASTAEAPLRVVADVPLPGSASRFDYQSLEPASGRLFISHMGAGQLVVFDVRAGRVIANLDGFPTVTGVLAVPVEHRAYASATGDHEVVVVNDSTFQIVARVPGPRFPDGIAYARGAAGLRLGRIRAAGLCDRCGDQHRGSADRARRRGGKHPIRRRLALCVRGGADREPAGGDRPGDRDHRPPDHFRQRGPVPARFLHRCTAPCGVHLRPGERHAGRAGSPDPSATSGAANRERS